MKLNNNDKKTHETRKILVSAKPIVFKKKNITKIADLVLKNKKFAKGERGTSEGDDAYDDDLSEEFFEKYFSRFKEEKNNQNDRVNSSNLVTQNNIVSTMNNVKMLTKNNPTLNNKETESNYIKNIDEYNTQTKKKIEYQSFASSIVITQCQIDSVKNIHVDISLILQEIPKNSPEISINKLEYLQLLDLSYNKIKEIHNDISLLPNLKILKLNNNLLSDVNKIVNLGNIKNLTSLNLSNNLICKIRGYRQFVIEMCSVLEQLDNAQVTEKELEIIHFGGSKYGEKRLNGNGKVIKYPKIHK